MDDISWIGLSSLQRLHQHSIDYLGDSFTGRKTQLTASKQRYKGKTQKKQTTENTHIHTKYTIKRDTYKTQQIP